MSVNLRRSRMFAASTLLTAVPLSATAFGTVSAATAVSPAPAAGPDAQTIANEVEAAGAQELFTAFLADVIEKDSASVVDHSWHGDYGVIVVTPSSIDSTQQLASAREVKIVVESANPQALAFEQRAEAEQTVLALAAETPAVSLAARYEPTTHSVVITAYTDDVEVTSQALDKLVSAEAKNDSAAPAITYEIERAGEAPQVDANHESQ